MHTKDLQDAINILADRLDGFPKSVPVAMYRKVNRAHSMLLHACMELQFQLTDRERVEAGY